MSIGNNFKIHLNFSDRDPLNVDREQFKIHFNFSERDPLNLAIGNQFKNTI